MVIIVVLVLLVGWGTCSIYDNYRYGQELYSAVNKMSTQCNHLARSIDYFIKKTDNDYTGDRHAFDYAMFEVRYGLGYDEDMPLLEDVYREWMDQFEKLYQQTKSDKDFENTFTDSEKVNEVANLRDQLYNVIYTCIDFHDSYNQMSKWERYFTSWEDEQKILNEKVRFIPLSD